MKYESKVKYEKVNPINGKFVTVSEAYLVENAETFSDAEAQTLKYMAQITNATVIPAIKISDVENIIANDEGDYYKAKIVITVIDEVSGKEKQIPVVLLLHREGFYNAVLGCLSWMRNTIVDCELVSISKTKIVDVI